MKLIDSKDVRSKGLICRAMYTSSLSLSSIPAIRTNDEVRRPSAMWITRSFCCGNLKFLIKDLKFDRERIRFFGSDSNRITQVTPHWYINRQEPDRWTVKHLKLLSTIHKFVYMIFHPRVCETIERYNHWKSSKFMFGKKCIKMCWF